MPKSEPKSDWFKLQKDGSILLKNGVECYADDIRMVLDEAERFNEMPQASIKYFRKELDLATSQNKKGKKAMTHHEKVNKTRKVANKVGDVRPGYLYKCHKYVKKYADSQKVPYIAIWTNGDRCGHCVRFASALDTPAWRSWMKGSGCVFSYVGPQEAPVNGSVYTWIRNRKTSQYPMIRLYCPSCKVDIATRGDTLIGTKKDAEAANLAIAWIKSKISGCCTGGACSVKKPCKKSCKKPCKKPCKKSCKKACGKACGKR